MDKQFEEEIEKLAQVVITAGLNPPNNGKTGDASEISLKVEHCGKGGVRAFGLRLEERLEELLGRRLYVFDQTLKSDKTIRIERLPDLR